MFSNTLNQVNLRNVSLKDLYKLTSENLTSPFILQTTDGFLSGKETVRCGFFGGVSSW